MSVLERIIEEKRFEMIYIAERFGLASSKTVKCSQELDKLLNFFYKHVQNKGLESRKIS